MEDTIKQIADTVTEIKSTLEPSSMSLIISIAAPIASAFIAVLIAYMLDRRSENKQRDSSLLGDINYFMAMVDLNIRTLFSLVNKAKHFRVEPQNVGRHIKIAPIKFLCPLQDIDINDLRAVNIDNIVTGLLFEFGEIKQVLNDNIDSYQCEFETVFKKSKSMQLSDKDFNLYNQQLEEIIKNGSAFIIRLVMLSNQLTKRAYFKLPKKKQHSLYETKITDDLVNFIKEKIDHPEIKTQYEGIKDLHRKGKIKKTFKGMEDKDVLIGIFRKIILDDSASINHPS